MVTLRGSCAGCKARSVSAGWSALELYGEDCSRAIASLSEDGVGEPAVPEPSDERFGCAYEAIPGGTDRFSKAWPGV